ncbi:MAG TPA: DUF92 domain-containing protein [Thermoanaerobaculia bacterium]|nr:DUF92 domain-containing protein [Thermoanaerobaculia bacterium]
MNDERGITDGSGGSSPTAPETAFATNEGLRQSVHVAIGLAAVTLKWLPWRIAAAIAVFAALGNWLLLHRVVGKRIARHERGWDTGLVLYPLVVATLIVLFNWHIELAAVAWVILAFGDGTATLLGRAMPVARLQWNREKSWGGLIGFLLAAGIGAMGISLLFGGPLAWLVITAVVVAGLIESMPLGLDDNITVPAAAATVLAIFGVHPFIGQVQHPPIEWGWLALNTVLAIIGYVLKTVDLSGFITGWALGTIIILGAGPRMYVALLAFFVIGTAATRLGYRRKAREGLAQEKGGRRGAGHAFANVGVAALCAIAYWRGLGLVPLFMGIAALATAAADTAGSEIGQLLGRRTFMPLTFRRVERGTDGAVSLEGTLAGIAGAFLVAVAGTAMTVHEIRPGFLGTVVIDKGHVLAVVTVCGFLGSYLESIVGSMTRHVPNHVMNFFNTAAGALLFWIAWNFVPMFGFEL